jgi:hypothetical protein
MKPWYKIVTPREDLREGKPLDASEFAVHLDDVRKGSAPLDYRKPDRFFGRTYLTKNLLGLSSEVIRRLSGQRTEASAVFNLATQFGGGKTHALTLLYHLARHGNTSHSWPGVAQILEAAGIKEVPKAATAVFVGQEFDSVKGRGGEKGEPVRKTPWGEMAWQLGGKEALALVAEHEKTKTAPGGEVIRQLFPKDKPCLILVDELMNYVSRTRKSGLGGQTYHFLQNLSEVARGLDGVVLAVSIPASELEMTAEDQSDYERFKKMLDRLGKAMVMSAETETSEIIRRRLFEWDDRAITSEGKVMLPKEALEVCAEYGQWVVQHREQLPNWFALDAARDQFAATYPFHPTAISVFERKWQELPRFQQTRGVLRMLALWVSHSYREGFKGGLKDPLIGLGTAPLEDSLFRSAVFEQLGEGKLEGAVTTDICGRKESHAIRLDAVADEPIKSARLHRKSATVIFFESNGGQAKGEATQPEVRLAVAEPGVMIGNVETSLEDLTEACYYLTVERNRYRFSLKENLNKRYADRRANIPVTQVNEYLLEEIRKVFAAGAGVERVYFPEKTIQVPDRPAVTFVVLPPEISLQDENAPPSPADTDPRHSVPDSKVTLELIEATVRHYGTSARTFKSALVFCVASNPEALRDEARKVLAWEAIDEEGLKLDETQEHQLAESLKRARRDMKETVWRSYKNLVLLAKDNSLKRMDLGLVTSSAANDLVTLILGRLRSDGDLEQGISPSFLLRNWPPAFKEWSTKALRDAFFAVPKFPRLMHHDALKETISRGVGNGLLAYVGKTATGAYKPFCFNQALMIADIEFSEDMFIVTKETAEAWVKSKGAPATPTPSDKPPTGAPETTGPSTGTPPPTGGTPAKPVVSTRGFSWTGEITPQKWMNFYTKVLAKFASAAGLKLKVTVEVAPEAGVSDQKLQETKSALRELGLNDDLVSK